MNKYTISKANAMNWKSILSPEGEEILSYRNSSDLIDATDVVDVFNDATEDLRQQLTEAQKEIARLQARLDETVTWNEDLQVENQHLHSVMENINLAEAIDE